MKKLIKLTLASIAVSILTGCYTTQYSPPPQQYHVKPILIQQIDHVPTTEIYNVGPSPYGNGYTIYKR